MALWPRNGLARKVGHGALPTSLALSSAPSFGPNWDRVMASSNERDVLARGFLKRLLLRKEHRDMSARAIAKQCGCSKFLVVSVRRELIAAGLWEPKKGSKGYKVGGSIRGGYVFGKAGDSVPI